MTYVQVGALAAEGKYDFLIIESSGISEPMQVSMAAQARRAPAPSGGVDHSMDRWVA